MTPYAIGVHYSTKIQLFCYMEQRIFIQIEYIDLFHIMFSIHMNYSWCRKPFIFVLIEVNSFEMDTSDVLDRDALDVVANNVDWNGL